jgi:plastocyanin
MDFVIEFTMSREIPRDKGTKKHMTYRRQTMSRLVIYGALLAGALALAGCGGSGDAAAAQNAGPVIVVQGLDTMRFSPDPINVKAGEPITITFKNAGVIAHDLITEGADRNARLVNVGGGRQQSATFLASKPGTYNVVCVQPGHKEAGMVTKIVAS